jgi:hypothetical protein
VTGYVDAQSTFNDSYSGGAATASIDHSTGSSTLSASGNYSGGSYTYSSVTYSA